MFKQTVRCLKGQRFTWLFSQAARVHKGHSTRPVVATSLALASSVLWYSAPFTICNDEGKGRSSLNLSTEADVEDAKLSAVVWGSNKSNVISPDTPGIESVKAPSVASWLDNVALRDLVLHEKNAACIDGRGDVYQWGDGFFEPSYKSVERKPVLTLRGKNITSLKLTGSRLFALSASGKVYVLPVEASMQTPSNRKASQPWWRTTWFWDEDSGTDFVEILPQVSLSWGEKFVSISAGNDHLLALTSNGRTFAHPISKRANSHGQLGFRSFDIPDPSSTPADSKPRLLVSLIPKSVTDPLAKSSPFIRQTSSSQPSHTGTVPLADVDDQSIRFCDRLYEIPALRNVKISQIATGGKSSFVRTDAGKILGWGANEYGQIGLGSNVTTDTISVPTEIVLWRDAPTATSTVCLDIRAGGDLTCFTVERKYESSPSTVDLLLCGNGQWGGLGNNRFSNVHGSPVRAKNVSGILEYCEHSQRLQPLVPHAISISPTGHVLLTLDTLSRSGEGGGRDLVVWGAGYDYQLGSGKRASLPIPTTLHRPDGSRFMLITRTAKTVNDFNGNISGKRVKVEQCAVAGYGNSVVYWKIC